LASWWTSCERGCSSRRPPSRRPANASRSKAARAALAAAALAAVAATGCGGAEHQPTHARFRARAEGICAIEGRKLAYIRSRARAHGLAPRAAAVLRKEAAASRAATEALEGLARPRGEGSEIKRWLTARTVAATIAIDLAEAPAGKDGAAVAAVAAELRRARARARALSGTFGGRACDAAV